MSLPIDRSAKATLDANLVNGILSDAPKLRASENVVYDTIDELNNKVNNLVTGGVISPYPPAQYNQLINGNFDCWQRGSSFTTPAPNAYTSDRWFVTYDGTIGTFTVSRQAFALGQVSVPNNPKYFYRWDQTVAGSGSIFRVFGQRIEGVQTFSGQKCTLSFLAKAESNRSIAVSARQFFGTGGTPSAFVDTISAALNLTTSWQKFAVTFTLPSISGKTIGTNGDDCLQINFNLPINTVMTMDFSEAQVNAGDQALPFQPRSLAEELALCRRYCFVLDGSDNASGSFGSAFHYSTTQSLATIILPVKMRVKPTLAASAANTFQVFNNGANAILTAIPTINQASSNLCLLNCLASGLIVGQGSILASSSASSQLIFDAEI